MKKWKSICSVLFLSVVILVSSVVSFPTVSANESVIDASIYMDSDTIITDAFEGFGVQWDPSDLYDYTDEQWASFVEKASFLKPNMMRVMIHDADSYCTGFENGEPVYDWDSIFMKRFYKIMDFAEENKIPIMIGEWVGPKDRGILTYDEFGKTVGWDSPVWAQMIVDVLEYLVEVKGYTCIRYYNMINEPNHKGNNQEIYDYWTSGIDNLRGLMDQSTNPKIKNIKIVGPDVYTNWRGWLDQTTSAANRDNIGINEVHWYVQASDIYNGNVEKELKSLQEYTYAKDPTAKAKGFALGEAGVAIGGAPNAGDQQLRTRYYQYGIEMFDLGLQSMRAGLKFTSAWGFEDSMHIHAKDVVTDFRNDYGPEATTEAGRAYVPNTPTGDVTIDNKLKVWGFWNELGEEIATQNAEAGKPGLYNIEATDEQIRPWYYTWSMMCRYFPEGSKVMYTTESEVDRVRATSALVPSGDKNDVSMAVVNASNKEKVVKLALPNANKTADLNQYFYYDREINGQTRAQNEKGQVLPYGVLEDVNLAEGVTVTLPANSCMILTTLGYEGESNPISITTGQTTPATGVKVNVESNLEQLTVGETYQMESTLIPSIAVDEVEWSVGDYFTNPTDKATITQDGKLTINKVGNIRITASVKGNPNIKGSVAVIATKTGMLNDELASIGNDGVATSYENLMYDGTPTNFGGAITVKRQNTANPGVITYQADGIHTLNLAAFSTKDNLLTSGNFVVALSEDGSSWDTVSFDATKKTVKDSWKRYELVSKDVNTNKNYQYARITMKSDGGYSVWDPQYGGGQIFFGEPSASNITITNKDTYIAKGATLQFNGIVEPSTFDQTIQWLVLTPEGQTTDIATIDSTGKLTANKPGKILVVGTTNDGVISKYYDLEVVVGYFIDDIKDFSNMYQYGGFLFEGASSNFDDKTIIKRIHDTPESIVYASTNIQEAIFELYKNGNLSSSSADIYVSTDGIHYKLIEKDLVAIGKAADNGNYTLYEVRAKIKESNINYVKLEVKNDASVYAPLIGKTSIVYEPIEEAEVKSLHLDEALINTSVGCEKQLHVKVAPNYVTPEITWSSSDEDVVTIDQNGKLIAKSMGEAVVTAKYNDKIYTECIVNIGKNLAIDKEITASSQYDGTNIKTHINDGDFVTRWASARNNNQWITIDLGEMKEFNNVKIFWEKARAKDYNIEVSKDGVNFTKVKEIRGRTDDTQLNDNEEFDLVQARYVRMQGVTALGAYGYSIYEMEVYDSREVTKVSEVTFDASTKELYVGEKQKIKSTTSPDNATYTMPVYTTSDDSVVYIKNHEMLALQSGTATITATVGGVTNTMMVTVVNENAKKVADSITSLTIKDGEVMVPTHEGYEITIESSSIEKIITKEGLVNQPVNTTDVTLVLKVKKVTRDINDEAVTKEIKVTVNGSDIALHSLKSLLVDAKAINESLYRPSTVATLKEQITSVETLLTTENLLVSEVQAAYTPLDIAYKGLELIVDKTTLHQVIADLGNLDEDMYTEVSYKRLRDAIVEAKMLNTEDATEADIKQALKILTDAKLVLVKQSDYDALANKVKELEAENLDMYTSQSLEELMKAIKTANEYLQNLKVTTERLLQGLIDLEKAENKLVVKANIDSLKDLIEVINSLDLSQYEEAGVKRLQTILVEVKEALKGEIDEETCKSLSQRLLNAYHALVKTPTDIISPNGVDKTNTGDTTNIYIFIGMLVVSTTTLIVHYKKKKEA